MTEFLAVLFYAIALSPPVAIAFIDQKQNGEEPQSKNTAQQSEK